MMYGLYRLGHFIAMRVPVKVSYAVACLIANGCYIWCGKARRSVFTNLKVVKGGAYDDRQLRRLSRRVFINFAKYLVDFFRFSRFDDECIRKMVKVEGLDEIDKGLAKGKGVIVLSAHLGNWELGGFVLSKLRPPMSAVVLSHTNKKIDDFFTKQRGTANLKSIPIGISLRACFGVLKKNGLLALLGDRDFSKNGIYTPFFGQPALIPKGPAVFACRVGSAIVPAFLIREKDDTFRFCLEKPIYPEMGQDEGASVKKIMGEYSGVIERYVRKYPDQWYVFRDVWNNNGR